MKEVVVRKGTYRNKVINNATFELVRGFAKDIKKNGSFILVKPTNNIGNGQKTIRITVTKQNLQYVDGSKVSIEVSNPKPNQRKKRVSKSTSNSKRQMTKPSTKRETDKQVMQRIAERFDILEEMTKATIATDIKAMIVSGPPGVGKSYGVEKQLEKASMFDVIARVNPRYEVVKGAITPLGLYATLYKHSGEGNVLVFDDCDMVLQDEFKLT
jgi:hypothetical protein